MARWNTDATPEQIEDAFQEACARAEHACVGQMEGEVYNWLRTTTHREIAHQRRRWERERVIDVPVDDLELADHCAPAAEVDGDSAGGPRRDRAGHQRGARAALRASAPRCGAAHARTCPPQIAEHLGLSERAVKRSMEQILAIGRDELVRLAGHGCEAGEGLVARSAFGLAGSREARLAQLHLATCPRCGAMYERLDLWREKVAAVLPVPAAAGAQEHVVERVVHAGTEVLPGSGTPQASRRSACAGTPSSVVAQLRDHATGAYYRIVDPTPLAGRDRGRSRRRSRAVWPSAAARRTACSRAPTRSLRCPASPRPRSATRSRSRGRSAAARRPGARAAGRHADRAGADAHADAGAVQQQTTPQPTATPTPTPPPPAPQDEYEPVSRRRQLARRHGAASSSSDAAGARAGGRPRGVRRTVTTDPREETEHA